MCTEKQAVLEKSRFKILLYAYDAHFNLFSEKNGICEIIGDI